MTRRGGAGFTPARGPSRPPLHAIAKAWEQQHVLPHCPSCARPCCKLETVVLDLDDVQARALYQITTRDEAALPGEVRLGADGKFYAHGKPCPAYDLTHKTCGVYGTAVKPQSCDDFPIYQDGDDAITADTRCEAIDLASIEAHLRASLRDHHGADADVDVSREPDEQFPVIVSFVVRRTRDTGRPPRRSRHKTRT